MFSQTKDIKILEQESKELFEASVVKKELLRMFAEYKSSRKGLFTFLFRNHQLTKEKHRIVDQTMTFIDNFEGTKEQLLEGLQRMRVENTEVSRKQGKFHYNLVAPNVERRYDQDCGEYHVPIVQPGESSNKSDLAALFHNAISIVTKQISGENIRKSLKA